MRVRPPKRKILIVDDEPDTLLTLKMILERTSRYEVTSDEHPREALAHFAANTYDLLLLDIRMPDINGFELYLEMKQLTERGTAMIPVCFITALADLESYNEYRLQVCPNLKDRRFFIKKPVESEDILKRVQDMLSPGRLKSGWTNPPAPMDQK